jgi:ABC-type lipoprotein release transport system permease subunit
VAFAVLKLLDAAVHLAAISLLDVRSFAAGLALVLAATMLAAYQPARRATRINPSEMLRSDT